MPYKKSKSVSSGAPCFVGPDWYGMQCTCRTNTERAHRTICRAHVEHRKRLDGDHPAGAWELTTPFSSYKDIGPRGTYPAWPTPWTIGGGGAPAQGRARVGWCGNAAARLATGTKRKERQSSKRGPPTHAGSMVSTRQSHRAQATKHSVPQKASVWCMAAMPSSTQEVDR